jgi:hypothetical protein
MSGTFLMHSETTYIIKYSHTISAAGVPCVPGYHGKNQDPDYLYEQAKNIGITTGILPHPPSYLC